MTNALLLSTVLIGATTPYGDLLLEIQPNDRAVVITIDGVRIHPGPSSIPLLEGIHRYSIWRTGYSSVSGKVDIRAGKKTELRIELQPAFPGSGSFFADMPGALQEAGRWVMLEAAGIGAGIHQNGTPLLYMPLMRFSVYSPIRWWPLYVAFLPLSVAMEPTAAPNRTEQFKSALQAGTYWASGPVHIGAGLHFDLAGEATHFSFQSFKLSWGADAQIGYHLGSHWALVLRYEVGFAQSRQQLASLSLGKLFF